MVFLLSAQNLRKGTKKNRDMQIIWRKSISKVSFCAFLVENLPFSSLGHFPLIARWGGESFRPNIKRKSGEPLWITAFVRLMLYYI